jgi:hypothetical protein
MLGVDGSEPVLPPTPSMGSEKLIMDVDDQDLYVDNVGSRVSQRQDR